MKTIIRFSLVLPLLVAVSGPLGLAQNTNIRWSSLNGGFAIGSAPNTTVKSAAGQALIGSGREANTVVVLGFLVNPLLRGLPVSVGENTELPLSYSLSQNYPNPFNPSTTIRYEIVSQGEARLDIFNIVGQKVATPVNETKAPGRYDVMWNGTNDAGLQLPSGVYFYRLHVNGGGKGFVAVMKLMLLK